MAAALLPAAIDHSGVVTPSAAQSLGLSAATGLPKRHAFDALAASRPSEAHRQRSRGLEITGLLVHDLPVRSATLKFDTTVFSAALPDEPSDRQRSTYDRSVNKLIGELLKSFFVDPDLMTRADECLATSVYFEARGEPLIGQVAVAEVVLNRVRDQRYPAAVCDVVFQNEQWRHRCQFSFACDGKSDKPRNMVAWERAIRVAMLVQSGMIRGITGNSTHYHATHVTPAWSKRIKRVIKIGSHIFYHEAAI